MKIREYFSIPFLVVTLSSCVDMRETFRMNVDSEFPLRVGSKWTYAHFDSLSGVADTLTVSIASERDMNDGSYEYIWRFRTSTRTVSCPVILGGTTVEFPRTPFENTERTKFYFPLKDLNVPQHKIVVPAGSFQNSFLIRQISHRPNTQNLFQYWISSGVGFVKISTKIFDTISGQRVVATWELASYTIPK